MAIGYVSCFMEVPSNEHLVAVRKILHYIAGTLHWGCFYPKGKEMVTSLAIATVTWEESQHTTEHDRNHVLLG